MTQGLAKEVARALRQHEDQSDSWDSVELLLGTLHYLLLCTLHMQHPAHNTMADLLYTTCRCALFRCYSFSTGLRMLGTCWHMQGRADAHKKQVCLQKQGCCGSMMLCCMLCAHACRRCAQSGRHRQGQTGARQ